MQEIMNWISSYSIEVSMGLIGTTALLLLVSIINAVRISILKKKNKKLNEILTFSNGDTIEDSLINAISFREKFEEEISRLDGEIESLKKGLSKSIQNIGFIRYNAFGDMGSDLSFSVAFLDEKLNGIVLTSIYGREDSNVYAKPIKSGSSDYKLSVEEIQALDRAIKSKSEAIPDSEEASNTKRSKEKVKSEEKSEEAQETHQN